MTRYTINSYEDLGNERYLVFLTIGSSRSTAYFLDEPITRTYLANQGSWRHFPFLFCRESEGLEKKLQHLFDKFLEQPS